MKIYGALTSNIFHCLLFIFDKITKINKERCLLRKLCLIFQIKIFFLVPFFVVFFLTKVHLQLLLVLNFSKLVSIFPKRDFLFTVVILTKVFLKFWTSIFQFDKTFVIHYRPKWNTTLRFPFLDFQLKSFVDPKPVELWESAIHQKFCLCLLVWLQK